MKYIIGNWKANKTEDEVVSWLDTFLAQSHDKVKDRVHFVICPPYPYASLVHSKVKDFSHVSVGSQDISPFEKGAYTGEVTALMLEKYIKYAIIGHSERRVNFKEDNDTIFEKVKRAKENNIEPIYCVRGEEDPIPENVKFIAYEPVYAIGTGVNEPCENVLQIKNKLKLSQDSIYIYGGSVTKDNIKDYFEREEIDGVLPGGASLDPQHFFDLGVSI